MKLAVAVGVVALVLVGAGVGYTVYHRSHDEHAESQARATATTAMADANVAEMSLVDQLPKALTGVATSGLLGVARAGDAIKSDVLPIIDTYLAKLDAALLAATAYLAFHPQLDHGEREALEVVGKRAQQFHGLRDKLAALADRAAKGDLSLDDLTNELMHDGQALIMGK